MTSFPIEVNKLFPKNVDDVVSPMKDFFVPRNESTCLYKWALPDVAERKLKILVPQFEMAKLLCILTSIISLKHGAKIKGQK